MITRKYWYSMIKVKPTPLQANIAESRAKRSQPDPRHSNPALNLETWLLARQGIMNTGSPNMGQATHKPVVPHGGEEAIPSLGIKSTPGIHRLSSKSLYFSSKY